MEKEVLLCSYGPHSKNGAVSDLTGILLPSEVVVINIEAHTKRIECES